MKCIFHPLNLPLSNIQLQFFGNFYLYQDNILHNIWCKHHLYHSLHIEFFHTYLLHLDGNYQHNHYIFYFLQLVLNNFRIFHNSFHYKIEHNLLCIFNNIHFLHNYKNNHNFWILCNSFYHKKENNQFYIHHIIIFLHYLKNI